MHAPDTDKWIWIICLILKRHPFFFSERAIQLMSSLREPWFLELRVRTLVQKIRLYTSYHIRMRKNSTLIVCNRKRRSCGKMLQHTHDLNVSNRVRKSCLFVHDSLILNPTVVSLHTQSFIKRSCILLLSYQILVLFFNSSCVSQP